MTAPLHDEDFPQATRTPAPINPPPAGPDLPVEPTLSTPPIPPSAPLATIVEMFNDLQATRIAAENRARALHQVWEWQEGDKPYDLAVSVAVQLKALEHGVDLNMRRALRAHPLGPWFAAQHGLGPTQGARLLAVVGDPYWNDLHDRPRTVSELWHYCGYHVLPTDHRMLDAPGISVGGARASGDPDPRKRDTHGIRVGVAAHKRKNQQVTWNPDARMRVFLIAESCVKHRQSPYRSVYDAGREKYADAVHNAPCPRCGPKGKPAEVGSPLSKGHQHARALRLVSKEILKDLWREAKRLHELP